MNDRFLFLSRYTRLYRPRPSPPVGLLRNLLTYSIAVTKQQRRVDPVPAFENTLGLGHCPVDQQRLALSRIRLSINVREPFDTNDTSVTAGGGRNRAQPRNAPVCAGSSWYLRGTDASRSRNRKAGYWEAKKAAQSCGYRMQAVVNSPRFCLWLRNRQGTRMAG